MCIYIYLCNVKIERVYSRAFKKMNVPSNYVTRMTYTLKNNYSKDALKIIIK